MAEQRKVKEDNRAFNEAFFFVFLRDGERNSSGLYTEKQALTSRQQSQASSLVDSAI